MNKVPDSPKCKKCGTVFVRFENNAIRCAICQYVQVVETAPEEEVFPTREYLLAENAHGEMVMIVACEYDIPEVDAEERELNLAWAEFYRYLFADQVTKDKRWGRDNLKARGFVRDPNHPATITGKTVYCRV